MSTLDASAVLREQLVLGVDVASDGAHVWTLRVPEPTGRAYRTELWYRPADQPTGHRVELSVALTGVPRFAADGLSAIVLGADAQLWRVALDTGDAGQLTSHEPGLLAAVPQPTGSHVAAVANVGPRRVTVGDPDDPIARHVRELRSSADGGGFIDFARRLVLLNPGEVVPFANVGEDVERCGWSPDGSRLWFTSERPGGSTFGANRLWVVDACAAAAPRLIAEEAGLIVDVDWSPDGRIAYAANVNGDIAETRLVVMNADGTQRRQLDQGLCIMQAGLLDGFPIPEGEIGQLCWDADGESVLAIATVRGRARLYRFPLAEDGGAPQLLAEPLIAAAIRRRDAHVALVAATAGTGADVYRLDADGQGQRLSRHGDWLGEEHWPVVQSFELDGLHAWLIEPRDAPEGPLPRVLHVHGGPQLSHIDLPWLEMVLLAAKGCRVLCPDPRGSVGYGDEHCTSLVGHWGEIDIDDLHAYVDAAVERGLADPERLAVMGTSYGGATTLRLLMASDRFSTGIAENLIANYTSVFGTSDAAGGGLEHVVGYAADRPDLSAWLAASPIARIEQLEAPLLLLHAESDRRCPISESEQIFTRLRALDRPVELVRFPEESHLMFHQGRPDRRQHRLESILTWLGRHLALTLCALLVPVLVAGCGSSSGDSKKTTTAVAGGNFQPAKPGKPGGALTVLYTGDVDYLDPGLAYYGPGWQVNYATVRPLYSYRPGPNQIDTPQPDLASAAPVISADRKTLTIKLRHGVRFAPPVNREVTSDDVKYGIERGFTKQVPNGYADAYFGSLVGAPKVHGDYKPISGIEAPDKYTIILHLTKPVAATVAASLVLPLSAPVPRSYARQFDSKTPSTYNTHVVASGPYMIRNDSTGKLVGYRPGGYIRMVRNPNWDKATDYRPAYLNQITIEEGGTVPVASQQVLSGTSRVSGDFTPPNAVLRRAIKSHPDNVQTLSAGGTHYVALNTTIKPFGNINVRRAIAAAIDRIAMQNALGGEFAGGLASGFIPTDFPGYTEAGGANQGTSFDFLKNPHGDLALAKEYLKKAGYPSGKYTGTTPLLMVGDNQPTATNAAQVAQATFEKLGFKVQLRFTTLAGLYTRFCGVPSAKVAICPTVSWGKDYVDPQSLLKPAFNGPSILPSGNSNYPQLNDPKINAAIAAAEILPPGPERLKAWAKIDKMVIATAAAVPYVWDRRVLVESPNVVSTPNQFTTLWDLSFTWLK